MVGRAHDAQALLSVSPLCRGAPAAAIEALASRTLAVERLRGEAIFTERHPAESLYLVVRGCIKLLRPLDNGRDIITELCGPGDIIGEAALCDDGRYSTRAVCVHPSTVLALPRIDVMRFLESNPAAMRNVVALLHDCVGRAESRLEDLATFGVRQRVVRLLIRLGQWLGRSEDGKVVVPVAVSRQEIADLVGTTLETAIRVMSALRREGLVVPGRRGFVLTDRQALEAAPAPAP